jgi:hypothetical protein
LCRGESESIGKGLKGGGLFCSRRPAFAVLTCGSCFSHGGYCYKKCTLLINNGYSYTRTAALSCRENKCRTGEEDIAGLPSGNALLLLPLFRNRPHDVWHNA